MADRPANIILCGFMGTGKTTVGRIIAAQLGWRFADTDRLIERSTGQTVAAIFADQGEAAFRARERQLCQEISGWRRVVVATGGGIVLDPANREALIGAGLAVCLEAPAEEIARRLERSRARPLLAGPDRLARIRDLLESRADAYAALPHRVNVAGRGADDVAAEIIRLWRNTSGERNLTP
jgi:shikimate kinase